MKSSCLCSGLHTQAVIPDKFLHKCWAEGQVPISIPSQNLETVQPVISSHRDPWSVFQGSEASWGHAHPFCFLLPSTVSDEGLSRESKSHPEIGRGHAPT